VEKLVPRYHCNNTKRKKESEILEYEGKEIKKEEEEESAYLPCV